MLSLTYLSRATTAMAPDELEDLLIVSRNLNERDGLTGLLLYADQQFIQTLEGSESAVMATMDRIRADRRHREVDVTWVEPIEARFFTDWSMGFRLLSSDEMRTVRGYTDFLNRSDAVSPTSSGRALSFHRWFRDSLPLRD